MPASAIGAEMPWDEAVRLSRLLRTDPSSYLAAAMEEWSHPISREALVLMDLFDLEHAVNSKKKPAAHPGRPWRDDKPQSERKGKTGGRSLDEVRALLERARVGGLAV